MKSKLGGDKIKFCWKIRLGSAFSAVGSEFVAQFQNTTS
jgi:hypothetical protein